MKKEISKRIYRVIKNPKGVFITENGVICTKPFYMIADAIKWAESKGIVLSNV